MPDLKEFFPTIEIASEGDIPEVIGLLKKCGIYAPGAEYMLARGTTLVARYNRRIIGTRSFRKTQGRFYHVYGLCVDTEFRRRGPAERLNRAAEREIYHDGGMGYVGEASSERVAQYYVRTLGVRLCRLSFRAWRRGNIPYKKVFHQGGFADSLMLKMRRFLIFLMKRKGVGRLAEKLARRIERL